MPVAEHQLDVAQHFVAEAFGLALRQRHGVEQGGRPAGDRPRRPSGWRCACAQRLGYGRAQPVQPLQGQHTRA